jgi:hypothetical protein
MTYANGTRDVGLWHRERLIKLCTVVDGVGLDLRGRGFAVKPEEHQRRLPKVAVVRQRLERLGSVNVLPRTPQPLNYGYEPSPELVSRSVLSDALPVTCLAADLQAFDEAFFAAAAAAAASSASRSAERQSSSASDRKSSSAKSDASATVGDKNDETGDVIAWNYTPSCMSLQSHVLRHSAARTSVEFDVDAVLRGERCGPSDDRGPGERSSECLIRAAAAGDMNVVSELIDSAEVNVDVTDRAGSTALFAATVMY